MNPLKISLAAHVAVLLAAFVLSLLHGCATTDETSEPPMFTLLNDDTPDEPVEQPDEPVADDPIPPPLPLPQPLPEPEPIVDPEADALIQEKKEEPPPPPQPLPEQPKPKPEIKIGPKIEREVKPPSTPKPDKPKETSFAETKTPVTTPNTSTSTKPDTKVSNDERTRAKNAINAAVRNEWIKEKVPQNERVRSAIVDITLAVGGRVIEAKIITSSGSTIFDNAALRAARRVTRIPEVTPAFLKENNTFRIPFDI